MVRVRSLPLAPVDCNCCCCCCCSFTSRTICCTVLPFKHISIWRFNATSLVACRNRTWQMGQQMYSGRLVLLCAEPWLWLTSSVVSSIFIVMEFETKPKPRSFLWLTSLDGFGPLCGDTEVSRRPFLQTRHWGRILQYRHCTGITTHYRHYVSSQWTYMDDMHATRSQRGIRGLPE